MLIKVEALTRVFELRKTVFDVRIKDYQSIQVNIADAGLVFANLVENIPDEEWDLHIAVLLSAPFHFIKRCLPGMKKKGIESNPRSTLVIVNCVIIIIIIFITIFSF